MKSCTGGKENLVYIPVHEKYSRDRQEDYGMERGDRRRRNDEKRWGGQNRIQTLLIKQLSITSIHEVFTNHL